MGWTKKKKKVNGDQGRQTRKASKQEKTLGNSWEVGDVNGKKGEVKKEWDFFLGVCDGSSM